jgi:hypothetical protein
MGPKRDGILNLICEAINFIAGVVPSGSDLRDFTIAGRPIHRSN